MAQKDNKRIEFLQEKFYRGTSTLEEEKELALMNDTGLGVDPAEEAMFALFRMDKEIHCPPLAMSKPRHLKPVRRLIFAASAAVAAVLVVLSVTAWAPEEPEAFCIVNGIPVTDPAAAMQQRETAIEVLLSALDNTASMMNPFEELEKAITELENLGLLN